MNYIIYRIHDNDKLNYIGSTMNYEQRIRKHKTHCFNEKQRTYNTPLYKFIRDSKIEWNQIEFEIIQEDVFDLKEDALKQETFWISFFDSIEYGQNACFSWTDRKKYVNNSIKHKQAVQKYRQINKVKINEKVSEKIHCSICHVEFRRDSLYKHNKTKKHLLNLKMKTENDL